MCAGGTTAMKRRSIGLRLTSRTILEKLVEASVHAACRSHGQGGPCNYFMRGLLHRGFEKEAHALHGCP